MARPKIDFPPAQQILAMADPQGRLAVRVTPGGRTESVEIGAECLLIKVRAKPEDGAANKAVVELLASALGVAKSEVQLLRGATSRQKIIQIPKQS